MNTGMRIGEILKLKWERIDLQQGYITVTRTKSGKDRKIPLNETVTKVLKNRERDGIYVFHADGKPYESVKKAFYAAQRRAGIKHCRFHDLRHHFATKLVLAGVSLPVVKELLGHSSIVTTMRYAHPTPEAKKEAVRLLEGGEMSNDRHYMDTSPLIAEIQSFISSSI
ncbi:MAG: site-specific integrase [Candidatus Aureabacteria bacterium]|nr:site-specific integrase [Candidatus Auribacterota bacterium]